MGSHASFPASAAYRWMTCGASAVIDTSEVPERESAYANRGTYLHKVAHQCLEDGSWPLPGGSLKAVGGGEARPGDLTSDECDAVTAYINYVCSRGGIQSYEVHSWFIPGLSGGTSDAVVVGEGGRQLEIIDFKSGSGVKVSAVENWQAIIYALGTVRKYAPILDPDPLIDITIHQPTIDNVHTWTLTLPELEERGRAIRARVSGVLNGDAEFNPDEEACRWCPARTICPALQAQAQAAARAEFEKYADPPDPQLLDMADLSLGQKLQLAPLVRTWAKAVEDEARATLLDGKKVDGFKVVEGRKGNRSWADRKRAKGLLESWGFDERQIFTEPVMVSPAQAEKLTKAREDSKECVKALREYVADGKPGAPTVVPETDPRPSMDGADLARRDFAEFAEKE